MQNLFLIVIFAAIILFYAFFQIRSPFHPISLCIFPIITIQDPSVALFGTLFSAAFKKNLDVQYPFLLLYNFFTADVLFLLRDILFPPFFGEIT